MAMKILIAENDPSVVRIYKEFLSKLMPEARIDIVISVGGFLRVADTRYDAYLMDEELDGLKSSFEHVIPIIQARFPDALVLHNATNSDPKYIQQQERLHRIGFARGPDGKVITCEKRLPVIMEFLRAMVVPREEAKAKTELWEKSPICQRPGGLKQAPQEFRRPLSCCRH